MVTVNRYTDPSPIAVGAVGGSGTRVLAGLLKRLGYFVGSDLNEAMDNLWFTFLFKRTSVLLDAHSVFDELFQLFAGKMAGKSMGAPISLEVSLQELFIDRGEHGSDWLKQRCLTLLSESSSHAGARLWGWKEPNTHVVLDRLLSLCQTLKYVHVTRSGFDMALSQNLNQLRLWGPVAFGRPVELTPRYALKYWCFAERRVRMISETHRDRVLFLRYEELCAAPGEAYRQVARFAGRPFDEEAVAAFTKSVQVRTAGSYRQPFEAESFDREDVEFVRSLGYEVPPRKTVSPHM